MVDPMLNTQHMNKVKHLVYVCSGCGNHSMLVWSLNHSTMITFVPQLRHLMFDEFTNLCKYER